MTQLRLPNFLVIGTQKGGTTSLEQALRQHKQIFIPAKKEVHYFSLFSSQPLEWYANHFIEAKTEQICAEATPYYLFHPAAAERINQSLSKVKLIVLLRDPVERLLSHYFHARRLGNESLGLSDALAAENERLAGAEAQLMSAGGVHQAHQKQSYFSRSCYEKQLPRFDLWQQTDRLLILRSEDLFEQPQQTLAKVLAFIGLNASSSTQLLLPQANRGNSEAAAVSSSEKKRIKETLINTYSWAANKLKMHWD